MLKLEEVRSGRIELIDVIRGFTLLGIILVHFPEQYYAGAPPEKHAVFGSGIVLDQIVSGIIGLLITGKFYMIFSFLFGLSFFIQLGKAEGSISFHARFFWRLVILLGIGLVHSLHYRGDILSIYAVVGVALLFCHRFPDKVLLAISIVLILDLPAMITRGISALNPNATDPFAAFGTQEQLELYFDTVKSGSYLQILNANLHELQGKIDYQWSSGRAYITVGLFLLGTYAGRANIFSHPEFFRKLRRIALWTLLGSAIFGISFFGIVELTGIKLSNWTLWLAAGGVMDFFNAALAAFYVCVVVLLFQKEIWKKRLMIFYNVGRMGLTTYLMQSVAGTMIFFSYGLGLLGDFGAALCALLGIIVFALQIAFSNFWLRHFQYGPVEWLWRSLTYMKIQPFRRNQGSDKPQELRSTT